MGLGAVDDDVFQAELLGDADSRGNVVRPVGVEVGGQFPTDDRDQRFQLQVEFRGIGVLVRGGTVLFLQILPSFEQLLPDQRGSGHAGGRSFVPVIVAAFGVFAQCKFHGDGSAQDHIVYPTANRLDGGHLAADGVGAARAGDNRGHAALPGLLKAAVKGVDGVNGPELGGDGVGDLVAVVTFKAQTVAKHTQMAMGVHQTGVDMAAGHIQHLGLLWQLKLIHAAGGGDFPVLKGHESVAYHVGGHGVENSVDQIHGNLPHFDRIRI